jgi:hypothetical protein
VAWLTAWAAAAALYLLLIDITDLPELIVGAGAAVLAAIGLELSREQRIVGESIRIAWLARIYRLLVRIPADIAIVSWVALRALVGRDASPGAFRTLRFRCGDDEALESGRRALAEAIGSVAPNTFVIGIDPERKLILAHQLRPAESRQTIDVLELG